MGVDILLPPVAMRHGCRWDEDAARAKPPPAYPVMLDSRHGGVPVPNGQVARREAAGGSYSYAAIIHGGIRG
jgi:hypothetical protein